MKVSREQVALNRERIVDTAARLFRQKGYDGIGVSDLMKSAGLTHGGFYGHFASKEDLLAAATAHALNGSVLRWQQKAASAGSGAAALHDIADHYLSAAHRDHPQTGCAIAALGPDLARLGPAARGALTAGARGQVAVLQQCLDGGDAAVQRRQALARYAAMVGAMVLARAVDDPDLSDDILAAVREQVTQGANG